MADEGEAEDQLPEPGLGDGQPEQELGRVVRRWGKGVVEGVVGLLQLLVNEFATDVVLSGQFGDRLPGEGVENELLALLGGVTNGPRWWW